MYKPPRSFSLLGASWRHYTPYYLALHGIALFSHISIAGGLLYRRIILRLVLDGRRAVTLFQEKPVAMDKIEFFIWDFRFKKVKEVIERLQKKSALRGSEYQ